MIHFFYTLRYFSYERLLTGWFIYRIISYTFIFTHEAKVRISSLTNLINVFLEKWRDETFHSGFFVILLRRWLSAFKGEKGLFTGETGHVWHIDKAKKKRNTVIVQVSYPLYYTLISVTFIFREKIFNFKTLR